MSTQTVRDLTDDEARRALVLKWGAVPPDVLPAWVAEMDYALAPVVADALRRAVADGVTGYPADLESADPPASLGRAYAGFVARRFGWDASPDWLLAVSDVTSGIRLALEVLGEDAPVALPVPAYPPQLGMAAAIRRPLVHVPFAAEADGSGTGSGRAVLDLDALDRAFADGARTLLLTSPHNPLGTVPTRAELEAVRDVVVRHGARVVVDEIHAPLVLPGATHVPYLSLPGTADHAVAVVSASKAFNVAGLHCAQVVAPDPAARARLQAAPPPQRGTWSPLGAVANRAAYAEGDGWLDALVATLASRRAELADLLEEHLPRARMRPLEATYLAWLDLRGYGHDDPAAVTLERARVQLAPGHDYHPGLTGHVRLNLATSRERLERIVRGVGVALADPTPLT